jgi:hypothetical protein
MEGDEAYLDLALWFYSRLKVLDWLRRTLLL